MHLYKTKIIRPISALLLALLFMVGNSPRQWMHDLFANHVDGKKEKADPAGNPAKMHQLAFHCELHHLVVESPFTNSAGAITIYCPANYKQFILSLYPRITALQPFQFSLRGPPLA